MTAAELECSHLSEVYDYLAEKVAQHGIHQQVEELIEEFINRANGLAGVNPVGLDALLAEFVARTEGQHDQIHDVGEVCIRAAFSIGLAGQSPVCTRL